MKKKQFKLRITTIALIAVLVLAFAGCSSDEPAEEPAGGSAPSTDADVDTDTDTAAAEPFTLRVITQAIFNEVIVADELGFFEDENIKVEYTGSLPQGVTEFQLLEQGEIDAFVSVHPPQVGQARAAGINAVSVAPGSIDTREYPHIHYLVQDGSDIDSLDDLVGKKVGISGLAACTNGFVDYYLDGEIEGYSSDQVEYVQLGNNQEQSLAQGLIDVSTSHNPAAGIALAAGGVHEIASSSDILQQENFSLAARGFTEDFIAEHPDVVQGFVNAMYRSRLWINAHIEDAIQLNADILGVDPGNVSPAIYEQAKNNVPTDIDRWVSFAELIGNWEPGVIKATDIYSLEFVPDDAPASDADIKWEGKS